ncbi:uncharacterized protein LOC142610479 [Castanea sativa]|uniref:uncharacterized protein LOC142610479 n=1 Tax=Castanea sativa TaxID=21020 RepID=UPI003F64C57F
MHDQVENDKLEREQRSQIPLPPPPPGRGLIPISQFRRHERSDSTNPIDGKRRKVAVNNTLEKAYQNNARHELDSTIARMFYTAGLPFNFARNPYYRNSYAYATTHSIPGYVSPGYNALRTTLLQKERAHVKGLLKPIKDFWLENGVSIVSDGWFDPQRRPLINIMAISDGGPVFIKAIDGSGEFKDKHYIAGVLKDAIKEIGHEKVVQVITDNASVMKAAGSLIEIADTRFASVVVMLKRLKLIKRCLQAMAISDQWASYREDDVGKAQKVKDLILSDLWWDNIDYILEFTAPIYDMLRIADTDKPCLHLMYEMWDSMIEKVKGVIYRHEGLEDDQHCSFWSVVYDILIDRWTKNCTPLHCLAHSLNPKYYSMEWLSENPKCIAPHRDYEISMEMSKCLDRYFEDGNELSVVKFEFAAFSGGRFPSPAALTDRNKMAPTRADDLVYMHSNLRLLSRRNEENIHTATKMWDIGGDSWNESDIHGGAGILESATLTLGEPELEAIVIGNVSTNATTSESEVQSESMDLDDEDVGSRSIIKLATYMGIPSLE